MKKKAWIIGTRGSKLALKQTEIVIRGLRSLYPDNAFQTRIIKTTGDNISFKPLSEIGGKGLFIKEIEEELLAGTIDIAVHSMKDLPAELCPGLCIGAVLKREDPRDVFISKRYPIFRNVPDGTRIGTSSLRRKAQILALNDTLKVIPLRGNIDTRIRKVEEKQLDGIILAYAGVRRMGYDKHIAEIIPLNIMVPPAGQGAIIVEARDNQQMISMLEPLNHPASNKEVTIERTIQSFIGGGCSVPLGINVKITGNFLSVYVSYQKDTAPLISIKEEGRDYEQTDIIARALKAFDIFLK